MISDETRKKWDDRIYFLEMEVGPDQLNDWERNFVAHLEAIRRDGRDLSIKQSFKLNEIYYREVQ